MFTVTASLVVSNVHAEGTLTATDDYGNLEIRNTEVHFPTVQEPTPDLVAALLVEVGPVFELAATASGRSIFEFTYHGHSAPFFDPQVPAMVLQFDFDS